MILRTELFYHKNLIIYNFIRIENSSINIIIIKIEDLFNYKKGQRRF